MRAVAARASGRAGLCQSVSEAGLTANGARGMVGHERDGNP